MAERANNPPPNRNNRPSRGMIAAHVEKLRAMAAQLLREARRLSGDGPEDTVSGWSAERAATASFGRIRASPTAWALFERGFAEGRRSTRANTPQPEAARPRAGPPGRVPPRRTAPAYQRHDVRDGRGRFRRPAVQPQADQTDERPMVQPQAQQPVVPPANRAASRAAAGPAARHPGTAAGRGGAVGPGHGGDARGPSHPLRGLGCSVASRGLGGEYVAVVIATTAASLSTSARSRPTTGLAAACGTAAGPASGGGDGKQLCLDRRRRTNALDLL
ncbi:transcriptional regulatory protein AlgP-like [Metopolophium dirhodum]|uniref:transcriptional regulatory protein AlgP-like n=1 Tax=Metopolophium dirhodum TaxID=44670 RepID=UPI00298FB512|nr:transcriptional regulatory protein AlgP-like [Metopolophium dirhodum]